MAVSKSASKKSAARKKASKAPKSRPAAKKVAKTAKPRVSVEKAAPAPRKRAAAKKAVAPRRAPAVVSPAVVEIDQRIAILRNNLRDLVEQAASLSGAANEELLSQRIAEQETKLALLTKQREELSPRR